MFILNIILATVGYEQEFMADDGEGLLDDEDLTMGTTAAAVPDGGCETKKRACKDCSCGRAEIEAAEEAGEPLAQPVASSACGNVGVRVAHALLLPRFDPKPSSLLCAIVCPVACPAPLQLTVLRARFSSWSAVLCSATLETRLGARAAHTWACRRSSPGRRSR